MNPTRGSRGPSRAATRLLGIAFLLAGCATAGRETAKAVPNDLELGRGLETLAGAYESLDVNRVMPMYAPGDYTAAWDNQVRSATGTAEHRSSLAATLANAKTLKVTLDPNFDAWRDGDRAWTSRRFTATGTKKSGEKIEYTGWHSAIWERSKDGQWQVAYEHFAATPPPAPPAPAVPPAAPAPVATPPPPPPVVTLPFGDVFFAFNKSAIRKDQIATLEADLELLKSNPDVRLLLEGHCDERGGESYNFGLGERRAEAVKKLLVARGVDPERLATVSYGKRKPFEAGHGEPVWEKNRRTHFVVIKAQ